MKEKDDMKVCEKTIEGIKQFRQKRGMTQAQLAYCLGLSSATVINNWENFRAKPAPYIGFALQGLGAFIDAHLAKTPTDVFLDLIKLDQQVKRAETPDQGE